MVKLRASKCKLKEVNPSEEAEFLNRFHYQGYVSSQVCYGLYIDNVLIMLMSFGKPRYNRNYDWELLRLCTRQYFQIYGGASRLFKHCFSKCPGSVVSYCNEDRFKGDVYRALGFVRKTLSKGYHYEKDGKKYNRVNFQKWKLLQMWPEYANTSMTEKQIMSQQGYTLVEDSVGQSTWVYNCNYKWYIYRININDYEYIGQHRYITLDDNYYGSGTILKRIQNKYNTYGTKTILVDNIDNQETANKYERCAILMSRLTSNNINILDGGTGYVHSKRKYCSNGHPHTEAERKHHSEVMKELWASGKFTGTTGTTHTTSDETKQKISLANKGKIRTDDFKSKMSTIMKGKSSPMKGKHLSNETKRKLSESLKGRHISDEVKQKISQNSKKVLVKCIETNEVLFSSEWKKRGFHHTFRRNSDKGLHFIQIVP